MSDFNFTTPDESFDLFGHLLEYQKSEEFKAKQEAYRTERNEYSRRQYWSNPKRYRLQSRIFRERHPRYYRRFATQNRVRAERRRARIKLLPDTLSVADWQRCLEYWHHRCAYCGNQQGLLDFTKICADHFIPLSAPDCPGTVATNIIPACKTCNSQKRNKRPIVWLAERFGVKRGNERLRVIEEYFSQLSRKE